MTEAEVVRVIYKMSAKQKKSCQRIADHLNRLGLPCGSLDTVTGCWQEKPPRGQDLAPFARPQLDHQSNLHGPARLRQEDEEPRPQGDYSVCACHSLRKGLEGRPAGSAVEPDHVSTELQAPLFAPRLDQVRIVRPNVLRDYPAAPG